VRRIAELDPEVGAFVEVKPPDIAAAGRLGGVPFAVKDTIDVRGMATRAGSALPGTAPAAADAPVVADLRALGAIPIGKTSTTEFASGVHGTPTRNPWDLGRSVGGSSAGSAAAVAAGMVPFALGTDTAGSVRIPAAWCGIAALRPRRGRLPTEGVFGASPSFDSVGAMARSVRDLAVLWEALTGEAVVGAARPRVGVWNDAGWQESDAARAEWDLALEALDADARVSRLALHPEPEYERARVVVTLAEMLGEHRRRGWFPARAGDYGPDLRRQLDWAAARSADEVRAGYAALARAEDWARGAFEEVDVVVMPTVRTEAPAFEATSATGEQSRRALFLTTFASLGDLAAVNVACRYRSPLPTGVQVVAPTERDALAFALAFESTLAALARATD